MSLGFNYRYKYDFITEQTGLPISDPAAVTANENWCYSAALRSMMRGYERKSAFLLPPGKYWSNIQAVSEEMYCFGLIKSVGLLIICSELTKLRGTATPVLP